MFLPPPKNELIRTPEEQTILKNILDRYDISLPELVERIFLYFYNDAEKKGIRSIFDADILRLDLGAGAANSEQLRATRIEEMNATTAYIRFHWFQKRTGNQVMPPPQAWFKDFVKKQVKAHYESWKRGNEHIH